MEEVSQYVHGFIRILAGNINPFKYSQCKNLENFQEVESSKKQNKTGSSEHLSLQKSRTKSVQGTSSAGMYSHSCYFSDTNVT